MHGAVLSSPPMESGDTAARRSSLLDRRGLISSPFPIAMLALGVDSMFATNAQHTMWIALSAAVVMFVAAALLKAGWMSPGMLAETVLGAVLIGVGMGVLGGGEFADWPWPVMLAGLLVGGAGFVLEVAMCWRRFRQARAS